MLTFELAARKRSLAAEVLVHFFGYVFFGALIGATVRLLVAKKAGGLGVSVLGGATGAFFGGLLGRIGEVHGDPGSAGFATALLGGFAVVAAYHFVAAGQRNKVS